MQSNLHHSTVVAAMRVLLCMLGAPGTLQKFRDGNGGGWLDETESVLQNRIGVLLGKYMNWQQYNKNHIASIYYYNILLDRIESKLAF